MIPVAEKNPQSTVFLNIPHNIKNSPTKLLVPGNAMLAILKIKKKKIRRGIVWDKPP